MNIERMRAIDRNLGIPLLFLLSLWGRVRRWIRQPQQQSPRRILFLELSEMGSAILAEPAMRLAQQRFDGTVYFCIFKRNASCLKLLQPLSDERVYLIRDDNPLHFIVDSLRFRGWCRRNGIDSLVDLELFSRYSALLTAWSGAANRVGFNSCHNEGLYRGAVHSHRLWYNPHRHIAQNYLALVHRLSTSAEQDPYAKIVSEAQPLTVTPFERCAQQERRILQRLDNHLNTQHRMDHNLIIINASDGGAVTQRGWPRAHYVDLIQRVLAFDPKALLLLNGAQADNQEAARVATLIGDRRCINIAGLFEIQELPYLYHQAKLMVSSDSGPIHFAAVTKMPVVALFGPETPLLYGPLGRAKVLSANLSCAPCVSAANHRRSACRDNQCMQMITPERVFTAVTSLYLSSAVIPIDQNRLG